MLEAEGYVYVIRLKGNAVLQKAVAHLLKRPVGRPPNYLRRFYHGFEYQATSWGTVRRVIAKVEWHPGDLFPRVGFVVTNLPMAAGLDHPLLQSARHSRTAHQGRQIRDQLDTAFLQADPR